MKNILQLCCFLLFWYFARMVKSQCQLAQICVHDKTVDECWGSEVLIPGASVFGCCPNCGLPTATPAPPPDLIEGCKPVNNTCLDDGTFAPVQCKGDRFTGRCFCSDKNGRRIFGQMWRDEASEMTCACSRRRAELEAVGDRVVTIHCTPSGDYEPLQCDDGICWCAQPKTGSPIMMPVPEADMAQLPCYSASVTGAQYLRQCESVVMAAAMIAKEQSEHGTNFFGNSFTFCDYDGSYGPYQILSSMAYCTGKNGDILGAWQAMPNTISSMNCNCARDTMIYFPERGLAMSETCLGNGNYRPNQNVGDIYYCVDTDGYPVTEFSDAWPTDNCDFYA